jgi:hypothetical protein
VVVAGRNDFVAEMMVDEGCECGIVVEVGVADAEGFCCVRRWRVGIELMLHLIEQRVLPLLLLVKDVDAVL